MKMSAQVSQGGNFQKIAQDVQFFHPQADHLHHQELMPLQCTNASLIRGPLAGLTFPIRGAAPAVIFNISSWTDVCVCVCKCTCVCVRERDVY